MADKNSIFEFLNSKDLCILSTSSIDGKTESAVMAYTLKDDFTILMNTPESTRKVKNIFENKYVSIVVGGLTGDPSVQIDAEARIADNQQSQEAKTYMLSKHPELANYFTENGKFIIISPTWLRYSDYSKNPPEIVELNLQETAAPSSL